MALPTKINNSVNVDYQQLLEGVLISTSKSTGSKETSRPASTGNSNTSTTIEPGKKFHLKSITVTCDRPYEVSIRVRKSTMAYSNTEESNTFLLGDKVFSVTIPYDTIIFEGGSVAANCTPITVGGETAFITMRMEGRAMPMKQLDNPDYRILVLSDSKTFSALDTGTQGERYYVNQLANFLLDAGKRVSIIDRCLPSSTSADAVTAIKSGMLDGIEYDLMVVAFGTNDANSSASVGNINAFKSNLTEAAIHRDRYMPNASIIFGCAGVTDKTGVQANIGGYRTAVTDLVAELLSIKGADYKVYAHLEYNAFAQPIGVKSDFFKVSEIAGNQVHYTMLGHDQVFQNTFLPCVKTTDFYLNKLKLT